LQAKINMLQETATRETQRADQLRKDALKAEADHLQSKASRRPASKSSPTIEQDALRRVEEIRQDLAHFDQRQKELREAEAQVRRWQDVEGRRRTSSSNWRRSTN